MKDKVIYVESDRVVVEVPGGSVRHSLETIQWAQQKLKDDLNMWLDYEKRLLTKRAVDEGCTCAFIILNYSVSRLHNDFCKVHRLRH